MSYKINFKLKLKNTSIIIIISLPLIDSDLSYNQNCNVSMQLNSLKQQSIFLYQSETWLQIVAYFRQNTIQFIDWSKFKGLKLYL